MLQNKMLFIKDIKCSGKCLEKTLIIKNRNHCPGNGSQLPRGEIPVFLACPDVDPMHSPKIGYSLCSQ